MKEALFSSPIKDAIILSIGIFAGLCVGLIISLMINQPPIRKIVSSGMEELTEYNIKYVESPEMGEVYLYRKDKLIQYQVAWRSQR